MLTKHKEVCLSINGPQSVSFEKGTIEFKNYFKKIPVPFKMYADSECNLKSVERYEGFYSKKYQNHVPFSFAYKLVCVDDEFTKPIVIFRGENAAYEFIEAFLKEYEVRINFSDLHREKLEKNLLVLVSCKRPQWLGLRGRIF